MKILYLNPDRGIPVLGDKGASVHVRAFVTAAAALGHEVVLACTTLGDGNRPPPANIVRLEIDVDDAMIRMECARLGLEDATLADPVVRRELEVLCHDRAMPGRLMAELDRMGFKPDLVYERHALFHEAGVRIAAALGVRRLLEVNAPLVEEQSRFRGLRLVEAARRAEAMSYGGAVAIVAVSGAVAAHVRTVVGSAAALHVVPNGVDLALFSADRAGADLRHRLGIGVGPVIGFVGSFKPWHGIGLLLDAFAALVKDRAGPVLVAVGEGPDLAMARERAAGPVLNGRVLLPGRVPHAEVPAWMAAMDLTVAPYLPQADFYFSPMKIVESLAAGKPVVAPRIGQICELVSDGETGLLFEPGSAAELGTALAALVDDPVRRIAMGEAACRFASARSWTSVVSRILDLASRPRLEQAA